jgi:hypothetical protein
MDTDKSKSDIESGIKIYIKEYKEESSTCNKLCNEIYPIAIIWFVVIVETTFICMSLIG